MANGSRPASGAVAAIKANRAASPRRGGQKIALRTVRTNPVLVTAALSRASYT